MTVEPEQSVPRVFISKATPDLATALSAREQLVALGLATWLSEGDLPPSPAFAGEIIEAIKGCQALLLILSTEAMNSENVYSEVDEATHLGLPTFVVTAPGYVFKGRDALPRKWEYHIGKVNIRHDGDVGATVRAIASTLLPRSTPATTPKAAPPSQLRKYKHVNPDADTFVGGSRAETVADLLQIWDEVVTQRQPQLVVLLGESGWGKTRIVQEFYRRLAASQTEPTFWPAAITGLGGGRAALRESRKRVAPALAPPRGACARFLWLGLEVDESRARVDSGLFNLSAEIGRALGFAAAADPAGPAARMVVEALGAEAFELPNLESALTEFLHTGSPDSGVLPGSVEAFWQGIRALWAVPDPIPAVFAIEDAHDAGKATVDAIELLATGAGLPMMVLACAQESRLDVARVDSGAQRTRQPLGMLLDNQHPRVQVLALELLPDLAMRELFQAVIPDLDPDVLTALVRKVDGNPYHARMLIHELERDARRGRLSVAWVAERGGDFQSELELQWRRLPEDARRMLSGIAVLGSQVPERISLRALTAAIPAAPTSAGPAVSTGWLRRLDAEDQLLAILRFLERPRWVIAEAQSHDEFEPDERNAIIDSALRSLEGRSENLGAGRLDLVLAELHVALALAADAAGVPFDRRSAVRSGLALGEALRGHGDDKAHLGSAQDCETLLLGHENETGLAEVAVLSALDLHLAVSDTEIAGEGSSQGLSLAKIAVSRAESAKELLNKEEAQRLRARAYATLSRSLRVMGDAERMAASREALVQAESALGDLDWPDPRTIAMVLHAQGWVCRGYGDLAGAAESARRRFRLYDQFRPHGPGDRRTLGALMEYAYYQSRRDVVSAVQLREDLLRRRLIAWKDDLHPLVAQARKELAASLAREPTQTRLEESYAHGRGALESLVLAQGSLGQTASRARPIAVKIACRYSDHLEITGTAIRRAEVLQWAVETSEQGLELLNGVDSERHTALIGRLAEAGVRLRDVEALEQLRQHLTSLDAHELGQSDGGHAIETLWAAAEFVAALHRFDRTAEGLAIAAEYGLVREERFPDFQPRGWRSTDPRYAKAGVL